MKYLLVIVILLLSTSANASQDCDQADTQVQMNECAYIEFQETDKALNETYQKALKIVGNDKEREKQFRENQRAWLKYRDLTCEFVAGPREEGGTIWPLIMNDCVTRLTKQRIDEIPNGFQEWESY